MDKQAPIYDVAVEAKLPEFDTERLFVANEKKFAEGEIERFRAKPAALRAAQAAVPGLLKPKDWKDYIRALDHYWVRLHDHMEEIADGLVPLKFFVINNGAELDEKIRIRVHIHQGSVHPAKQPPQRPERIDGDQHVPSWTPSPAPLVSKFSRSDVKVSAHTIEATFSQLDAQDSADLVHQILYVHGDEHTRFTYEIRSERLGVVERGEVGFI